MGTQHTGSRWSDCAYEFVDVLERRGRHIEEGIINIGVDNRKTNDKLVNEIRKTNDYAQNEGA